tara:strand:+ start:1253 stop:2128 length:876 start_codon:yes stop_codon:yes gene_type:complete
MSGAQKRIAAAVIFSAALVSAALFLRIDRPVKAPTEQAVAVVNTAPERQAIPEQDKNGDGVPDWQEALQTTKPLTITGEPDEGYKAPETLTEQFALEFFQDMVRAENYGAFGDSPETLVASAADSLAREAVDEMFTAKDITTTSDTSTESLARYGDTIASIMFTYSEEGGESETDILLRALRSQNENDLQALDMKIVAYGNYVEQTKKVIVPNNMTREHLLLLNSYQAILSDIIAMRNAFGDPMLALLRVKRYQEDAQGLFTALDILYTKLINNGAQWEAGSPAQSLMEEG